MHRTCRPCRRGRLPWEEASPLRTFSGRAPFEPSLRSKTSERRDQQGGLGDNDDSLEFETSKEVRVFSSFDAMGLKVRPEVGLARRR